MAVHSFILLRMSRLTFAPLLCVALSAFSANAGELQLRNGEVVAFLGGTNIVNLQNSGHLESIITAAYPLTKPRFVDMAWEGDTVYAQGTKIERWREDKFGNVSQQLRDHGVTLVIAQFGKTESFGGPSRLKEFADQYEAMIETFQEENRRVIILSPTRFERPNDLLPDPKQRNADLDAYVSEMKSLAITHNCRFVNLLSFGADQTRITANGVHLKPEMQHLVSVEIAKQIGISGSHRTHEQLTKQIVKKHQLWMNYWRPANWKCLYGDDGEREFGKATAGGLTLREEWKQLPDMIAAAENRIWQLAVEAKGEER